MSHEGTRKIFKRLDGEKREQIKPAYIIIVGALTLLSFALGTNRETAFGRTDRSLTGKDKTQITRSVLQREFAKRKLLNVPRILLLENSNLTSERLPKIPSIQIELIDRAQIMAGRQSGEPISYFFIGEFEIKGKTVRVPFGKRDMSKRSSSGSGSIYEYRRIAGRWRGRVVEGFGFCGAPGQQDR